MMNQNFLTFILMKRIKGENSMNNDDEIIALLNNMYNISNKLVIVEIEDPKKVGGISKLLNKYLGKRKVDILVTNSEEIDPEIVKIYETQEQKDLVVVDSNNIKIEHINKPLIKVENNIIRHDNVKLALEIMNILIK